MTNLIDSQPSDVVTPFRRMADRIELNRDEGFAGAFVIVQPDGVAIENLFLNNLADAAMFWAAVQTIATMAIDNIDGQRRGQQRIASGMSGF